MSNSEKKKKYKRKWRKENKELGHASNKRYRQKQRKQALEILGGKCCKCGFSDERALQIDHIDGHGNRELTIIYSRGIYKKIINGFTQEYQLLCANCNWIKRVENKETRK